MGTKHGKVLVLGATGGIGSEAAQMLAAREWEVTALTRGTGKSTGINWLRGDALNRAEVMHAASGVDVIVHAVNPPGYRNWAKVVLPMLDNTIAAAETHHATVILPGTLYNYGPDALPLLTEESPQHPVTRKGRIRVEMEQRLKAFASRGGKVIIVRAGDFFGPKPGNNWFSQGLVKPGQPVGRIANPGTRGVGHQWSYLPDVARTMVALIERRDELAPFATFHMQGHWDADGTQMAAAVARVVASRTGRTPPVTAFPWWLLYLASPFHTTAREMLEMRYLWRKPVQMNGSRLRSVLGTEPHTPLDEAVEATLAGMGSLS
jgi:nucleoside-diphosphate-sugar epimerase